MCKCSLYFVYVTKPKKISELKDYLNFMPRNKLRHCADRVSRESNEIMLVSGM